MRNLLKTPFVSFARKEFYHIFRDRWTTIILLIMPVVIMILFGFAITTEVKNAKIAILDPSRDDASRVGRIERVRPHFCPGPGHDGDGPATGPGPVRPGIQAA